MAQQELFPDERVEVFPPLKFELPRTTVNAARDAWRRLTSHRRGELKLPGQTINDDLDTVLGLVGRITGEVR